MNAQISTSISTSGKSFLQRALLGNAAFSGISGLVMVLASGSISEFLGLGNPVILVIVGSVLLLYMPMLVWLSNQSPVPGHFAWEVIALDLLWVIGSLVLIFTDLVPLTTGGKWAIAITADIVALFAILQYIGLRRQQSEAAG
jgi:hypothetical protein